MSSIKVWLEATRPKTLPAAVAPVLLATAMACADGEAQVLPALICLTFALLIQIGTNFANDYLDGIRGTDTDKRLGPQRAVAAGLIQPKMMRVATIAVLAVGFCVGLTLIPFGGWWLLGVGIASVVCAWLYTGGPYPLAYNGLGDVFVVLFFGLIAVSCTYYVQVLEFNFKVIFLGLSCGLLVNNILVVNNYRDLAEDLQANKRTLVVLYGRPFALRQYIASTIIAGGVVLWLAVSGYGWVVLLGLVPVVLSLRLAMKLPKAVTATDYLIALKGSAQVVALYGVLLSIGLLLG
ncbi:MAG: 1,4-dihydroxy-2-naphthoate polyprenyltransferase [Opitutaceae bacterium]